jgi:hypothetical protein
VKTPPGADIDSDQNLLVVTAEENYKIPTEQTYMGFGEAICLKTKSVGNSRRGTRCN